MAKKGYKKFANEIVDNIQKKRKKYEEDKEIYKELFENKDKLPHHSKESEWAIVNGY